MELMIDSNSWKAQWMLDFSIIRNIICKCGIWWFILNEKGFFLQLFSHRNSDKQEKCSHFAPSVYANLCVCIRLYSYSSRIQNLDTPESKHIILLRTCRQLVRVQQVVKNKGNYQARYLSWSRRTSVARLLLGYPYPNVIKWLRSFSAMLIS